MKYRESGMPSEELWESFFKPEDILKKIGVNNNVENLIDVGCGYGTFLIPAANLIEGHAIGVDVDDNMIEACKNKVKNNGISNISLITGDISKDDTIAQINMYNSEIDYITLFNILHCERPIELLKSVYNIIKVGGKVGVIHWNYEKTPRGPSMDIRPKAENIIEWALKAGFLLEEQFEFPPYHYGVVFVK